MTANSSRHILFIEDQASRQISEKGLERNISIECWTQRVLLRSLFSSRLLRISWCRYSRVPNDWGVFRRSPDMVRWALPWITTKGSSTGWPESVNCLYKRSTRRRHPKQDTHWFSTVINVSMSIRRHSFSSLSSNRLNFRVNSSSSWPRICGQSMHRPLPDKSIRIYKKHKKKTTKNSKRFESIYE